MNFYNSMIKFGFAELVFELKALKVKGNPFCHTIDRNMFTNDWAFF